MTAAYRESDLNHTANTPYLVLTGQLWGVCWENIKENLLRYNGTSLCME